MNALIHTTKRSASDFGAIGLFRLNRKSSDPPTDDHFPDQDNWAAVITQERSTDKKAFDSLIDQTEDVVSFPTDLIGQTGLQLFRVLGKGEGSIDTGLMTDDQTEESWDIIHVPLSQVSIFPKASTDFLLYDQLDDELNIDDLFRALHGSIDKNERESYLMQFSSGVVNAQISLDEVASLLDKANLSPEDTYDIISTISDLGDHAPAGVPNMLVDMLSSRSAYKRHIAISGLVRLKDKGALQALKELQNKEQSTVVKKSALRAIQIIEGA